MNYVPEKFKLSPALMEVLGIEVETRPRIIAAIWHYVKARKLQNPEDLRFSLRCTSSESIRGIKDEVHDGFEAGSGEASRNAEKERRSDFFNQPWVEDAVIRYLNRKPAAGSDALGALQPIIALLLMAREECFMLVHIRLAFFGGCDTKVKFNKRDMGRYGFYPQNALLNAQLRLKPPAESSALASSLGQNNPLSLQIPHFTETGSSSTDRMRKKRLVFT
uniref:DM2 domain-containing protein n=1 Tax=Salix viminalis TaxID=40686 RepID=A0A6N2M9Z8_SALVM